LPATAASDPETLAKVFRDLGRDLATVL